MSDQSNQSPKRTTTDIVDQNFLFGDTGRTQKIDAWEGDADFDLTSDSGEMSLANLHFGTAEEAELTKSDSTDKAPESNDTNLSANPADEVVAVEVLENESGALIGALNAFDDSAIETGSFYVSDARFEVVGGDLRLVEGVSLNFEDAASVDVSVSALNADGNTITEVFTIDVIDVNDAPTDLTLDGNTVSENDAGATVGTLSSFDPDAGDSVTYTVSDDRFEVVDGELRLADGVALNHEDAANIEVTVTATDSGGLETSETFDINVADVNEGPSDLALDGNTVSENDAGATV
ncbi:MAG: cadherin repeat domain-containing protein, partial [Pseudomonadota bacterium]